MEPHPHNHAHEHGPAARPATAKLALVLALTSAYTVAEVVGGLLTGSLALLADAGHMVTDNVALGLALFAAWLAVRPPDAGRTYGYRRAEILAALGNGIGLLVACAFIAWEAVERFGTPHPVAAGPMGLVAAGGLVVNLVGAWVLHDGRGLNVRGAFLHVIGDLLGSIGALLAAVLIGAFGWLWADPAASLAIVAILLYGSGRLVLDAVRVLMEAVPADIDSEAVRRSLLEVPGVAEVHDLHVWCLAEGSPILTAHLVADRSVPSGEVLRDAAARLSASFGITHVTIQVEPPDFNILHGPGLETSRRSD